MHDLSTQYGFNEEAGNFQFVNLGGKGKGNDGLIARAQETSSINDANFATSPDGQSCEMSMFFFDSTSPKRDGAMENDIPVHEYMHGISNRLTGGAANVECLQGDISSGLDEGWSDAMAVFVQRNNNHTRNDDAVIGDFVANNPKGIRTMPYSTDMKRNTLTYSALNDRSESHQVGEIWTTMLYEVFWNLVDRHGLSDDLYDSSTSHGNVIAIQIMFGGLALQPCEPDFIAARDAFLLADYIYYKGEHKCDIWKGFAKRGLGFKAESSEPYQDNFEVPPECK